MTIQDALDFFLSAKEGDGLSKVTIKGYRQSIGVFVAHIGGPEKTTSEITVFNVRDYIRMLQAKDISRASVERYVRELKVWCRWLRREDIIAVDPFTDRVKVPTFRRPLMPFIPDTEFRKLLDSCNRRQELGRRDYAILCFLWDTGVRVSELSGLRVDAMDISAGTARVTGKGAKERMVFFSRSTAAALLGYRARLGRVVTSPHFFTSVTNQPILPNAVNQMIRRLSHRAGVTVNTNPHAFRHSFARNYLIAGGDLHSLQRLLGHSSLEVVRLYLNLSTDDLAEKHRQFSPMTRLGSASRRRS